MKVIVYAIARNEEKFVERWYQSMSEADSIYVLDTGSTDDTVKLLRDKGVNVISRVIKPWRFDVARNESLKLVPDDADICVCTDLDEVFSPGWRQEIERLWDTNITRIKYRYNWLLENEKPVISFYGEKIHCRNNYKWVHPVHEVLQYDSELSEKIIIADMIVLNHYPDNSKSRSSYLPLLELSVLEDTTNDRNMHYLGREYMYYSEWDKCIDTLIKHLNLSNSVWKDERCASMRFISRSYINLGRYDEAKMWLEKAIKEAPYLREPYVEMAFLHYRNGNYMEVIKNCTYALTIKDKKMSYINERFCWDYTIDDLLSISYYNLGLYDISLFYVERALKYENVPDRIVNNRNLIDKKITRKD